ncbi:hypothetical protein BMF94_5603 [Rhodotorula taiwanensis]|uniref:Uncharacterized protein n=1 Tax=Rhodotorula taiwanensis TaxID=741276 RepID=A0A2S5B3M0_9BASI|nr:hypothetical protein BMF94_5603 [Rhodotorula taiwanensis]
MALLKRTRSLADFFRPPVARLDDDHDRGAAAPRRNASTRLPRTARLDPDRPDLDAYARQASTRSHSSSPTQTRRQPPPPMIRTTTAGEADGVTRSGTVEDILTAYYAESPTKSRHAPISSSSAGQFLAGSPTRTREKPMPPQRMDSTNSASEDGDDSGSGILPVLSHHDNELTKARKDAEANKLQAQALKSSQRSSKSGRPSNSRSKSSGDLDLIDRLDISGLYGGGGFIRHEGPYAAAMAKGQGANAPINAFDPSAFSLAAPTSNGSNRKPSRRTGAGSSRPHAQSVSGLDDPASRSLLSPYAAAAIAGTSASSSSSVAGGSSSEVSLGFPARHADNKGQQLQEIYGVRDAEAWEDYGRARYDDSSLGPGDASGATSGAASRESILPGGPVSKEDRMQRAQSIWDIEATLKAGKPVGAASSAPPPVPILPQDLSAYAAGGDLSPSISNSPLTASGGGSKPKRSKSLAARFRAGRKNPNNPMLDADPSSSGEDGRIAGTASGPGSYDAHEAGSASVPVSPVDERRGLREWPLGASVPASIGATHAQSHANGLVASVPASRGRPSEPVANGRANGDVKQLEVRTQAIKFDESLSSPTLERASAAAAMNRSLTDDGSASPTSGSGKKSNGLKRLFSTKRKT